MRAITLTIAALIATSSCGIASAQSVPPATDRGDRIEQHLDNRGDRIEQRDDKRAAWLSAHGHAYAAQRLDNRGERINNRLDRRGARIDRRFDHRHGG